MVVEHVLTIGASGFEPPTSWSRTRRANRTALRPATVRQSDGRTVGPVLLSLSVRPSDRPTVRPDAPRRTRTPSLLIRSQALHPVELWARLLQGCGGRWRSVEDLEVEEPSQASPTSTHFHSLRGQWAVLDSH